MNSRYKFINVRSRSNSTDNFFLSSTSFIPPDLKQRIKLHSPFIFELAVTIYRQVAGACECGEEPSVSIKRGEFLDQLQTR